MNIAAATPAEILAVVKWWARARGFLTEPGKDWTNHPEWVVHPMPAHVSIGRFAAIDADGVESGGGGWRVSVALAWALLVESDAAPVWTGRCKACNGKKGTEVHGMTAFVAQMVDGGWATPQRADGSRDGWMPCSVCERTGEMFTPVAVLLLDAVESVDAREYLVAHADQLLAVGNPLGDLLAWALRLWTGEPTEPIVQTFTGTSDRDARRQFVSWLNTYREPGVVLTMLGPSGQGPANRTLEEWTAVATLPERGHPHTAEAVRWLEWLTWGTYSVTTERPMTASEIAAAFNEQGGPATFVSADDGRAISVGSHEASWYGVTAELREPPAFIPEPETPRHQPHARHISDRLGRRLGVRR